MKLTSSNKDLKIKINKVVYEDKNDQQILIW